MTEPDPPHEPTAGRSRAAAGFASGAGGVVTIMHTDVEGSTALTARAGDEVGQRVLSETKRVVEERGEANGGTLIDAVGDAMMLTFTSTRSAIVAAMAIQGALADREASDPDETLRVRIGLNAGEVIGQDETLFGAAINAGARVMAMADGGEILVSDMVRRLAGTIPGVGYRDRGRHRFKGFDEPWQLYQVVWEGAPAPRAKPRTRRPAPRWAALAAIVAALAVAAVGVALVGRDGGSVDVATNSVARLDGRKGTVGVSAEVGQRPGASVVAFDSLWVAQPDRGVVARLSLEDGTVRDTIRVGASPAGMTAGGGSIWVTNGADGTVSRINPGTNEETQTLTAGSGPAGIAYGDGALWVADSLGASLVRLDPETGARRVIPLAGRPSGVAFTPNGVWVTFEADGVARVDPRRRSVTFTESVGNNPTAIIHAFDSIWVTNHLDGTVSRLDPSTGRQEGVLTVGDGPGALAAADGRVWVANEFDDTLTTIDPGEGVDDIVAVGSSVSSLAADGSDLWLAAAASATAHRGGTLQVSTSEPAPKTLDPAVVYDQLGWQILSNTGSGLMGFRKVGGPAGATLVPDLAAAPPDVSQDGLVVRFPLRRGIRYSTGEPVQPVDFRRAIERTIVLSEVGTSFYGALRGVASCAKAKVDCDLSRSILTDDESVTFRLHRPDPDLPFKLALSFAFPVPVATPMSDQRFEPIPSTGPYVVAATGDGMLRLERNASFEEWSRAAQPDGFVDAIAWRFGESPGDGYDRLQAGSLDLMASPPDPGDVATLKATSPQQLILATQTSTLFVGVDTLKAPFDDPRVRRALNYAIDRERVVELAGGPDRWRATCQIFPPTLQGYQPFCPYTVDPQAGVWSAPALDRAKALVRRAGAQGHEVVVSAAEIQPGVVAVMRHVVDALDAIGLRATLEVADDPDKYLDTIYRGSGPGSPGFPQVYVGGWATDYPRASDYIDPQFLCRAPVNVSGYCNPRLDAAIDGAKRLSTTNPGAADRAWTAIEHRLVREAIWAPLFNRIAPHAFSSRTGNVQIHPQWGVLLSRVWVQ
jgi:peptide/nickel transport system substrate-binding protein